MEAPAKALFKQLLEQERLNHTVAIEANACNQAKVVANAFSLA
ncbi:hypothetical protein [Shewanella mangrovisoli]